MTANTYKPIRRTDIVREYFRRIDRGEFPAESFSADFEFYLPKFGIGRGLKCYNEAVEGFRSAIARIAHHNDTLKLIDAGDMIVVEGTTEGLGHDNVEWYGGRTPGGRFCSVFEFNDAGKIKRMYVYLDPDFTSADKERFLWPERKQTDW